MDIAGLRIWNWIVGVLRSISFLFFVIVSSSFCQTAQTFITAGDQYFHQYDMANAFEAYQKASQMDSTNFDALWKMAETLIELGNELPKSLDQKTKYLEAEAVARKAVNLNPNHFRGHVALALAFDRLASTQSGSERVHTLNLMRIETEKALKLNDKCSRGFWLLGKWHREMANASWLAKTWSRLFDGSFPASSYKEAAANFQHCVELDDTTMVYRLDLGKTFVLLEQWDDVKTEFDKALDMRPLGKNDRKYQRDATRYLEWLAAKRFSELKDAVEEY